MGGCPCKTFTVNGRKQTRLKCIEPFVFSVSDAESVLMESEVGDYLLYRDFTTDRVLLSVRYHSHIRHHRISEDKGLYYLNGQPYPYLDSIVLYHRQHRLDSLKLKKQAQLSARVVRLFAHKITSNNGNSFHIVNHENIPQLLSQHQLPDNNSNHQHHHHHYDNANYVADDEEQLGEEKTQFKTINGNVHKTDKNQTQTSPQVRRKNGLTNGCHSNGKTIIMPSVHPLSSSNVTSGRGDENDNEPDNDKESSTTPGNTTPTENALESPQPDAFLQYDKHKLITATSKTKTENDFFDKTNTTTPLKNNISRTTSLVLSKPSPKTKIIKSGVTLFPQNSSFSKTDCSQKRPSSDDKALFIRKSPRRAESFLSTLSSSSGRKSTVASDTDTIGIDYKHKHPGTHQSPFGQIHQTPAMEEEEAGVQEVSANPSPSPAAISSPHSPIPTTSSSSESNIIYTQHF